MTRALLAWALLCALPHAPDSAAQAPGRSAREEVARLESWPAAPDEAALAEAVLKLRKARTPEMERSGRAALAEIGAAAAPALLAALGREKEAAARERLVAVLRECTTAAHTRLLARELGQRSGAVRCFALAHLAAHPDAGVREAVEAALARALEGASEASGKGSSESAAAAREERELAALACASAGSAAGLELVLARAERSWPEERERIALALAPLRASEAGSRLTAELVAPARGRRLAALRLLAACGDARVVAALRPSLDESDRELQAAAVDALRALVDGDPPLGAVGAFELIEHLQHWKERFEVKALLALLFASLPRAEDPGPECPWCRGEPELMAAAGVLSHGGFEFGKGPTSATDALLSELQLVWIETPHFEIGHALAPYKVKVEEREELRAELERLSRALPDVSPKAKVLDPWLRAHLLAQRAEEQWRAFLELVRVEESAFPDGSRSWNLQGEYMGEGPYLGMKGKYEVLVVPTKQASVAFLRENYGITHEQTQRWHQPSLATLSVTIHLQQGQLREDRALHGHLAFNLAHNFLDGFKHYSYDTPIWLHEGLAHWMERRISPESNSFDSSEGALAVESRKSDWRREVLALAAADELPSFSSLVRLRTYADLGLPEHFATWSIVDFLLATDPEGFAALVRGLKGIWDLEKRVPDGSQVPDRQRALIQERYGASYFELDQRWKQWVLETYRERKR